MTELPITWLTDGLIDFEYKKYVLLSYLQSVSRNFDEQKLYPFLADLIAHYQNLIAFKESKNSMEEVFPQHVKRIDVENFRIEYERIMHDDTYLEEIAAILDYALPRIKESLEDGKNIYEYVECRLDIQPVGILPLKADEGYMLLNNGKENETRVFSYAMSIFENQSDKYRTMRTNYICSYTRRLSHTHENIKIDLMREFRNLPNPATFAVSSRLTFPFYETLLPIAKRSLVRFLAKIN